MSDKLVFITGATGFVGFAVLLETLKAGYRVRFSVRQSSQTEKIKGHPSVAPFLASIEGVVVVPDITVDGAFDAVLDGVTYIEHIASPLPSPTTDPEKDIIIPAVKGTTGILSAAMKNTSVRRIVITSSVVAVMPGWALAEGDNKNTYTPASRVDPLPKAPWGNFAMAYRAAKSLALAASDQFLVDKKPQFTIVNIMPGYVIGSNDLATDTASLKKGSNALVLGIVCGQTQAVGPGRPCQFSDVHDVARIQVEALDEEIVKGSRSYFVHSGWFAFDDAIEIAKRYFPDAVASGVLPLGGSIPCIYQSIDGSSTFETFGPLTTYEESVKGLLANYLALFESN